MTIHTLQNRCCHLQDWLQVRLFGLKDQPFSIENPTWKIQHDVEPRLSLTVLLHYCTRHVLCVQWGWKTPIFPPKGVHKEQHSLYLTRLTNDDWLADKFTRIPLFNSSRTPLDSEGYHEGSNIRYVDLPKAWFFTRNIQSDEDFLSRDR